MVRVSQGQRESDSWHSLFALTSPANTAGAAAPRPATRASGWTLAKHSPNSARETVSHSWPGRGSAVPSVFMGRIIFCVKENIYQGNACLKSAGFFFYLFIRRQSRVTFSFVNDSASGAEEITAEEYSW